jgi:hypothetical protein
VKIRIGRHQQVLLTAAGGDREAMTGEIEQRSLGAFGRVCEVVNRLLEGVEANVLLHRNDEAGLFETRGDEIGVDLGVGERRVVIGAVANDERDAQIDRRRGVRRASL